VKHFNRTDGTGLTVAADGFMICCPKTATDSNGRTVVFSNIGYMSEMQTALALPRDTWLDRAGTLRQAFVPELAALRVLPEISDTLQLSPTVSNGTRIPGIVEIPGILGHQMEIKATIYLNSTADDDLGSSTEIGVAVLGDSGWAAHVAIGINISATVEGSHVFIDRRSIGNNTHLRDIRAAPLGRVAPRDEDGDENKDDYTVNAYEFHIIVDHSIITTIINNHTALTVEVYPESLASMRVGAYAIHHSTSAEHGSAARRCDEVEACCVTMGFEGWFLQRPGDVGMDLEEIS